MIKLTKKYIKKAAIVLANAFIEEPHILYYFPKESFTFKHIIEFFRFRIKYGILFGEVFATSKNLEGISIWIPDTRKDITFFRIIRSGGLKLFLKCGQKAISRMELIGDITSKLYKKYVNPPYMTLTTIGVHPKYQSKGYARYLIDVMLEKLDKDKIICCLETTTIKNVKMYEKFGFQILKKEIIPNTSLSLYLMLRKPKQ